MTIFKKICSAILLIAFLGLAGCPEVAQDSGGGSSSRGSSSGD
jgi:hypothetical protein